MGDQRGVAVTVVTGVKGAGVAKEAVDDPLAGDCEGEAAPWWRAARCWYTVSVLERDKEYTVKYTPSPEGVPEGKA